MKLHTDGTVEGTPEELAAYMKYTPGARSNKRYIVQQPPINVSSESEDMRQQREYGKIYQQYVDGMKRITPHYDVNAKTATV